MDARLKEIKILKTLEIKKPPKLQKIQKAKGKSKQKVQPTIDEKHKDKTKKGKKNIREEFPEILLAEDMFFETVEKVGSEREKKRRKLISRLLFSFLKINLHFTGKRKIRIGRGSRTEILDVCTKIRYKTIETSSKRN